MGITAQVVMTVDLVITRYDPLTYAQKVILVERGKEPYAGKLALPGGKLDEEDADLEVTAMREAREELGLYIMPDQLRFVGVYSRRGRDPRPGRWISILYTVDLSSRLDEALAPE